MVYNDWRGLTHQNAYAPDIGKIQAVINLFTPFTYRTNRPYDERITMKLKEIDNSAFITYWLEDVVTYITYENVMPWTLYEDLKEIPDRNEFEGPVNVNYDFYGGDIVFLSDHDNFTDQSPDSYYIGVWLWDKFLAFDDNGIHTASLSDLLNEYPNIYTHMSVFRI